MKRSSYNPTGLVTSKPINLRLMPQELSEAHRISAAAGISKSNLARLAYLKGLSTVVKELKIEKNEASESSAG